ncbi:MAG TPA: GlsB/YeaQ/YmgE family stress response membrane protein [Hydrogenophaga sp.]|nr:GlsB/YeaQ/YmgE family stress response membrane protein [Hydrogenophaga sp.]
MFATVQTRPSCGANMPSQVLRISFGTPTEIQEQLMNLLIWLIAGGVIGWLASILMRTNDQQGRFFNLIVGVVGAMFAGWFISPLIGVGTIDQDSFSLHAMLVSFLGSAILLAIVNAFPRGRAH